jgi:hypothetical protein
VLRRPWWIAGEYKLDLDWAVEKSAPVIEAIISMHKELSKATGAWRSRRVDLKVSDHAAPAEVLWPPRPRRRRRPQGEVFGYRNLFMIDGMIGGGANRAPSPRSPSMRPGRSWRRAAGVPSAHALMMKPCYGMVVGSGYSGEVRPRGWRARVRVCVLERGRGSRSASFRTPVGDEPQLQVSSGLGRIGNQQACSTCARATCTAMVPAAPRSMPACASRPTARARRPCWPQPVRRRPAGGGLRARHAAPSPYHGIRKL